MASIGAFNETWQVFKITASVSGFIVVPKKVAIGASEDTVFDI
jgi:hypothetical protein